MDTNADIQDAAENIIKLTLLKYNKALTKDLKVQTGMLTKRAKGWKYQLNINGGSDR